MAALFEGSQSDGTLAWGPGGTGLGQTEGPKTGPE